MSNINSGRIAADSIHISRKTIVQYKDFSTTTNDSSDYIRESISSTRFEDLFNEFKESFNHAYKTYIFNLQGKEITYDNLPYYDGKTKTFTDAVFSFNDIEHCFGLPFKNDPRTKEILKKLVNSLNTSNKNKKIDHYFDVTDNERYFLFEVDKAIGEYISSTNTRGFEIVIDNIYDKLNQLSLKYPNNLEIQRELLYQSRKIHKMLTNNAKIKYTKLDQGNSKDIIENTFINDASKLIIKQLSKKPQNLDILNLNKIDNGTNKMVRVIRRNLSSFDISPDKKTLIELFNKNEKVIKSKVIEELSNLYLREIITDENVLQYASKNMIEDTITGKKILDAEFIKNNIDYSNASTLKNYDIDSLYGLIKNPNDTKEKDEIIENVNNLLGAWIEINNLKENGNIEDIEMVEELINLQFHEMLSNKDYQVEFTKRSITPEIKKKLENEISRAINTTNLGVRALRNYEILSGLFVNDDRNYIEELSTELHNLTYSSLEQKLCDLELRTRKNVFEMESLESSFDVMYSKYDMIDLVYFLTENDKVKEKLREIYNKGEDSINYKKIANKSEVISDLNNISDYQMIIRRVREKVTDKTNHIIFPEDNYLNSPYPRTNSTDKNNIYVVEIPISNNTSNLIYFPYDRASKQFKPSNVLSNVELVSDQFNNKLVVATVDEPEHFLATEGSMIQNGITIESSVQYNLSLAKSSKDNYYKKLTEEHNTRFNNLNSVNYNENKSEYHDAVYKVLDFGEDNKLFQKGEFAQTSNIFKSFSTDDKEIQINSMFKPISIEDNNSKKI